MSINQKPEGSLKNALVHFVKAFQETVRQLIDFLKDKWEWLKEKTIELYQLNEIKESTKGQYRMNFTRCKFSHQVIDRRPKQMIRKIIH